MILLCLQIPLLLLIQPHPQELHQLQQLQQLQLPQMTHWIIMLYHTQKRQKMNKQEYRYFSLPYLL